LEIEINSQKKSKFIKVLTIKTMNNLQPGQQTNLWKNKLFNFYRWFCGALHFQ